MSGERQEEVADDEGSSVCAMSSFFYSSSDRIFGFGVSSSISIFLSSSGKMISLRPLQKSRAVEKCAMLFSTEQASSEQAIVNRLNEV